LCRKKVTEKLGKEMRERGIGCGGVSL